MSYITDKLKFLLSANNLTQASTLKAFVQAAVSAGLFTASPQVQDSIVSTVVMWLAFAQGMIALINLWHNENKGTIVVQTQPKG